MIYQTTRVGFLIFIGVSLALAATLRLCGGPGASSRILSGLLGSSLSYLISPPLAIVVHLISPRRFQLPDVPANHIVCITPTQAFMTGFDATVGFCAAVGVHAGFAFGCWAASRDKAAVS